LPFNNKEDRFVFPKGWRRQAHAQHSAQPIRQFSTPQPFPQTVVHCACGKVQAGLTGQIRPVRETGRACALQGYIPTRQAAIRWALGAKRKQK